MKDIYATCLKDGTEQFHLDWSFLFKVNRLCIPKIPLRQLLVKEVHEGTLGGNFDIQKTLDMLAQNFDWLKMLETVGKYILRCASCIKAKPTFHKGEYKP